MKNSYLTAGITLKRLSRLVRKNPVSYCPKYLFRLIFLSQSALWSSVFAIIEKKRFRKKIENTELPPDPVFIIGHWRTGSTLLHKLMSLDPQFDAPTLFQVAEPDSFLTSYLYYKPVMKVMVGKYRPMDKVLLGMNEPQEDEYAIYRITDHSPLEDLIFPKEKKYFLSGKKSFLPENDQLDTWKNQVIIFYKKLFIKSGKPAVFKNPFNSLRIKELISIFPDARFIHITRHPFEVVPSAINMWSIVQRQNVMNSNKCIPTAEEVSAVMAMMMDRIEKDKSLIPLGNFGHIAFEDLDKDPVSAVKSLYASLNIDFTEEFRKKMEKYLLTIQDFEKNTFTLSEKEKEIISQILKDHMNQFGYSH